jgi:Domain of unknown function (DUF4178)
MEEPQTEIDTEPSETAPLQHGHPRQFNCPNCGGTVKVTAVGHTVSVVCQHCSSILDAADENVRILTEAHEASRPTLIDIGKRGVLKGIHWEVIGYVAKTDEYGRYPWDEYLLFNPFHGFRFLVQSDGHWTLSTVLKKDVKVSAGSDYMFFDGRSYRKSSITRTVVSYVKGEFYWRIKKGETWLGTDYACAPYLISVERNDEEINRSLGEYLVQEEVRKAFDLTDKMPPVIGVKAHQPNALEFNLKRIWKVATAAFVAAIIMQIVTSSLSTEKAVLDLDVVIPVADKDKTYTSDAFVIPKTGNLKIESRSPVSNNWVELDLSLVNTETDEEIDATQAIEYYSGQDSDGAWSEGSTETENVLSHIPSGTYRLLIDLDSGVFAANQDLGLRMMITNDVNDFTNFLIVLVMLAIYPLVEFYRYWRFEKLRWADSE